MEVTCWRNFIHSWRSRRCHSWRRCAPHCLPIFSKWRIRFKKYRAGGMTCAAWLSLPINYYSVSVLIFVEYKASFMSALQAVFSLLVGILSDTEYLCPTLGMFCAGIVVPPPPISLMIMDNLVLGVLIAEVVRRVYGRTTDPQCLRDLSNVFHQPLW